MTKEKYFPNYKEKLERQPEDLGMKTKQKSCTTMSLFNYEWN